jgi:ABC-2 type transport system permease protein
MNGWHKIRTVATFEFLSAVKRRGYLIATFGMPLFMAVYAGVVAVPAYFMGQKEREPSVYGVVDPGGVLRLSGEAVSGTDRVPEALRRALESAGQSAAVERITGASRFTFRPYANESDARSALLTRQIKRYFVLPSDYAQHGGVDSYGPEALHLSNGGGQDAFSDLLRQHLLAGKVDGTIAARVLTPVGNMRRFAVKATGEVIDADGVSTAVRIVMPVAFMVLFLLSVLMTSGYLMQGTATEKENKVVDVLLASANPDEVLGGKLLGLGAAGLMQIIVWLGFLMVGGLGILPLVIAARMEVPWMAMALALPLFVVSFLFFGSLMLSTGSLGSNMREAQQLAMVWSLTAALPLLMMAMLIQDPHGTAARVMSWIPLTSAAVVVLRASLDPASLAWWEVAGAFIVLLVSVWFAIRIGGRLFRIGLLSSSRPTLGEVLRQARLK